MSATYRFWFGGVGADKPVRPGWSIQMTANGRNRFTGAINSYDGSYRPALDTSVLILEQVEIQSITTGNPPTITTREPHGLVTTRLVSILGSSGNTPSLNADWRATVLNSTQFTVPVNLTVAGSGGYAARSIFLGEIQNTRETGLADEAVQAIITNITAASLDVLAERRYVNEVLLAGTVKSMLITLIANYLSADSITIDPFQVDGPSLPDIPCEYALLRDVLDKICQLAGDYVWEIDSYAFLRVYLPSSEAAPFNIGPTNPILNVDGDITVEPTRSGYVNHVTLRFTNAAVAAWAFLGGTTDFANDEIVTIGSKTYKFQTTLTDSDGNIQIAGSLAGSLSNLANALAGNTAGGGYAPSTSPHGSVFPVLYPASSTLKIVSSFPGAAANTLGVSDTAVNARWFTEGGGDTSTLVFGADAALTNVVIAENTVEQGLHGLWPIVLQAPEITDSTLAQAAADAYLAMHVVSGKKITYATYALGLRPGQAQTVDIPWRDLDAPFVVTDVNSQTNGNLVRRNITLVENTQIKSSPQWRDTYRVWSGKLGGASGSISVAGTIGGGGGSGIPGPPAAFRAMLGAARHLTTITTGYTVVPDHLPVLAPPLPPTGAYKVRAEIWARDSSITVQAALYDVTSTPALVADSESAIITSTTPVEVTMNVTLIGDHRYELRIKSDPSGEYVGGVGQLESIGGVGGASLGIGGGSGLAGLDYNVVVWTSGSSLGTDNLSVESRVAEIDAAVYISPNTYVNGTLEFTATFARKTIAIVSNTAANPTVVTLAASHGLTTGATVTIDGVVGSIPDINGTHIITTVGGQPAKFTIPVNVTTGGTGGRVHFGDIASSSSQHVGFGLDFINAPWIIISTHASGDLEARTFAVGAGSETTTVIDAGGTTTFGFERVYKIVWGATDVKFYIDGVLKSTHTVTIATAQNVMASDFGLGTNSTFLVLSNIKINGTAILI